MPRSFSARAPTMSGSLYSPHVYMLRPPDDLLVTRLQSPLATPSPVPLSPTSPAPVAPPAVVPPVVAAGAPLPPVVPAVVPPPDVALLATLSSPHAAKMAMPAAAPPIWNSVRRDNLSRKLCGARILTGSSLDGIAAPWEGSFGSRWLLLLPARPTRGFLGQQRTDTRRVTTNGTTRDRPAKGWAPCPAAAARSRRGTCCGRRTARCRRSGKRRQPRRSARWQ